jgi:Flp pilus assembly protein TadG
MRQVTVTADATGVTAPVVVDQYLNPANITYTKTGSGTVQVSYTDPYPVVNGNFVAATFTWVTAPTTAPNAANFIGQPIRAIRLSGAAENDVLTVIQSGAR